MMIRVYLGMIELGTFLVGLLIGTVIRHVERTSSQL
jgi:hypothetical protein